MIADIFIAIPAKTQKITVSSASKVIVLYYNLFWVMHLEFSDTWEICRDNQWQCNGGVCLYFWLVCVFLCLTLNNFYGLCYLIQINIYLSNGHGGYTIGIEMVVFSWSKIHCFNVNFRQRLEQSLQIFIRLICMGHCTPPGSTPIPTMKSLVWFVRIMFNNSIQARSQRGHYGYGSKNISRTANIFVV